LLRLLKLDYRFWNSSFLIWNILEWLI